MSHHQFNFTEAMYSPSKGYQAYKNYKYENNTLGITDEQFEELKQKWHKSTPKWDVWAQSQDSNDYELPDGDFDTAFMEGKSNSEEKTGYKRTSGKAVEQWGSNVAYGASGLANAGYNLIRMAKGTDAKTLGATKNLPGLKDATKKAQGAYDEAFNKAGDLHEKWVKDSNNTELQNKYNEAKRDLDNKKENLNKSKENQAKAEKEKKDTGVIISCMAALATGTLYTAQKPNKEETEVLTNYKDTLAEAQSDLLNSQSEMKMASDEVAAADEEANLTNEEYQARIEEEKADYETFKVVYDALKTKAESGEQLTDDEKQQLSDATGYMQGASLNIVDLQESASDDISSIHTDMATYQDVYTDAQTKMADAQGRTEFAADFDKATQINCYIEMAGQGLNAASGAKAAIQAGKLAIANGWNLAGVTYGVAAAAGAAGAVMSGLGAYEQYNMAGAVSEEIDVREGTENINLETASVLDTELETFEFSMDDVGALDLDIPDETEAPEDISLPENISTQQENNPDDEERPNMIL